MKAELMEHEGCFEFNFTPETPAEIVIVARFGIMKTKYLRSATAYFNTDGTASCDIVIGKRKNSTGAL